MKKLLLVVLALWVSAAPALALGPLGLDAALPLQSKYIWRGMNQSNDYVLQPSLDVGVFGFTFGVWANMDLTDINDLSGDFTEIDYKLAYQLGLPFIELGAGFLFYDYPAHDRDNTSEFYLSAKTSVILSPSLALFQDIDKYKGAYWLATIAHGFQLGESSKLDMTAGLGLGSENFIKGYYPMDPDLPWNPEFSNGASITDFYIDLRIPFHPIPFLTIAPNVTWTSLVGDAKDSVAAVPDESVYFGKTDNFLWGLTAVFSF